jgi:hypothetical protein
MPFYNAKPLPQNANSISAQHFSLAKHAKHFGVNE